MFSYQQLDCDERWRERHFLDINIPVVLSCGSLHAAEAFCQNLQGPYMQLLDDVTCRIGYRQDPLHG